MHIYVEFVIDRRGKPTENIFIFKVLKYVL